MFDLFSLFSSWANAHEVTTLTSYGYKSPTVRVLLIAAYILSSATVSYIHRADCLPSTRKKSDSSASLEYEAQHTTTFSPVLSVLD